MMMTQHFQRYRIFDRNISHCYNYLHHCCVINKPSVHRLSQCHLIDENISFCVCGGGCPGLFVCFVCCLQDINSPNVLPQIYDGAIDELITGTVM